MTPPNVIPNSFRDLCFDPLVENGGPLTENVTFSSDQRILASLQRFFYNDANHSRGEVEKLIAVGVPSVSGRETGTISKVKSQPGSRSRAVSISV